MKRSDRLGLVARVFDGRQREAAAELGRCEKALANASRRLDELRFYRAGYAERKTATGAMDPRQLRELSVLVERLDAAIRQQQAGVAGTERNRDEARDRWLASRQRHHAVSKVCSQQIDQERLEDDRREQKESDELTARRFPIG